MESRFVVAQLNARLQPLDRGELFEDPLLEILEKSDLGTISGGGTLQDKNGEVVHCDIDIELTDQSSESVAAIIAALENLGAPKGSVLHVDTEKREFGLTEGLAVYLNGTDLPDETYAQCDSNFVYSEFDRLLAGIGQVSSFWQGPTETAFYMYGTSFADMKSLLEPFLSTYPLCAKCRVVQVA